MGCPSQSDIVGLNVLPMVEAFYSKGGHTSEALFARIGIYKSNYASAADMPSLEYPRELKSVPGRE